MAQLTDLYIKLDTLKTLVSTLESKKEKGIALTIGINDEPNNYGQNVVATISQSKEERDAKKNKYYVGNGKTFWSNNNEYIPPKNEAAQQAAPAPPVSGEMDDLPF
jgi:hypothetical protein